MPPYLNGSTATQNPSWARAEPESPRKPLCEVLWMAARLECRTTGSVISPHQVEITSTSPRLSRICKRTMLARRSRKRSTHASPTLTSLIQRSGIASGR